MAKEADRPAVVVRGMMRTIEYAVCANGSMPAKEFIEEKLNERDLARLVALFQ